ncbi:MAG: RIO1 family regulatory kinase/ATPase domain-containing protein, partial [Methanobacteriota archaeon]
LHRAGIVHGDLTTSNMIVRDGRVVMIDFSLGGKEASAEARGVDLHLLREALTSAHAHAAAYYRDVLAGYRETFGVGARGVVAKVREIEGRGRYT